MKPFGSSIISVSLQGSESRFPVIGSEKEGNISLFQFAEKNICMNLYREIHNQLRKRKKKKYNLLIFSVGLNKQAFKEKLKKGQKRGRRHAWIHLLFSFMRAWIFDETILFGGLWFGSGSGLWLPE